MESAAGWVVSGGLQPCLVPNLIDAAVEGRSLDDTVADVPKLDPTLAEWGREGTR